LKVPTYHKYGLTKARVDKSELRDRKISDILTHHLTIGIGIVLGILVYILNYSAVQPSTVIQAVMQVFLFASMGVICVGIPAVLFKLAEMLYFKYISPRSEEKQSIKKYQEDRHQYDFWKIRQDYSFWRVLDGLSFEREIMNIYMHLGYSMAEDEFDNELPYDRILTSGDKRSYVSFNTSKEISEAAAIELLLKKKSEKNCDSLWVFSQKGLGKKASDYAKRNNVELYDINGLIRIVKTIKLEKQIAENNEKQYETEVS
jgi:hypothetical protein